MPLCTYARKFYEKINFVGIYSIYDLLIAQYVAYFLNHPVWAGHVICKARYSLTVLKVPLNPNQSITLHVAVCLSLSTPKSQKNYDIILNLMALK